MTAYQCCLTLILALWFPQEHFAFVLKLPFRQHLTTTNRHPKKISSPWPCGNTLATTTATSTPIPYTILSSTFSESDASVSLATQKTDTKQNNIWTHLVSGPNPSRPPWAIERHKWIPTWLLSLRPISQLIIVILSYIFHMAVLSQHQLCFPVQLIPNDRGHFQSIGLDSLAGMATLALYNILRRNLHVPSQSARECKDNTAVPSNHSVPTTQSTTSILPSLFSPIDTNQAPWKNLYQSKKDALVFSLLTMIVLIPAFLWTANFSPWWENLFAKLAALYTNPNSKSPTFWTLPMQRSMCVLFSHLSWVTLGSILLRFLPRPQKFFENTWYTLQYKQAKQQPPEENQHQQDYESLSPPQWVWWTIGGYYISSWVFNMADLVNQWLLPISLLTQGLVVEDSIVNQLVNPEGNDWMALIVGCIAPCIVAPWWEEILYRGFLLPALMLWMAPFQNTYAWAVFWNGVVFALHHMSLVTCLPLAVLGWTWNILYAKSGNLVATILVHAMWNARIFLGSWFGL